MALQKHFGYVEKREGKGAGPQNGQSEIVTKRSKDEMTPNKWNDAPPPNSPCAQRELQEGGQESGGLQGLAGGSSEDSTSKKRKNRDGFPWSTLLVNRRGGPQVRIAVAAFEVYVFRCNRGGASSLRAERGCDPLCRVERRKCYRVRRAGSRNRLT